MFRPAVQYQRIFLDEVGHVEASQIVTDESLQSCRHVFVETLQEAYGKRVPQAEVACLVVDGVTAIGVCVSAVEVSVGIEAAGRLVGLVDVFLAEQLGGVYEAGDRYELTLDKHIFFFG